MPTADIHDLGVVPLTYVRNVARAMLAHPANPRFINTDLFAANGNGHGTKMSAPSHNVALAEMQDHVINPTNPGGTLNDGIEHRLHVGGRATDDTKHLGRCRPMLQRLSQLCIALLDLLEQPNVFNGDHSLIGERFKKCDLFFGKRINNDTANEDNPNRNTFAL